MSRIYGDLQLLFALAGLAIHRWLRTTFPALSFGGTPPSLFSDVTARCYHHAWIYSTFHSFVWREIDPLALYVRYQSSNLYTMRYCDDLNLCTKIIFRRLGDVPRSFFYGAGGP